MTIDYEQKIRDGGRWYHTIELAPGVIAHGEFDMRPHVDQYGLPDDLSGKAVIDVGAAGGFFSFEAEKRGADVVAYDLTRWQDHDIPAWWFAKKYAVQTPEEQEHDDQYWLHGAFEVARELLGSRVRRKTGRIYELPQVVEERFDFAIFSNVLLHLRDPLGALEAVREVLKPGAKMILSTAISVFEPEHSYAAFMGDHETASYWFPSQKGLLHMCTMMGFEDLEVVGSYELVKQVEPIARADIVVVHAARRG